MQLDKIDFLKGVDSVKIIEKGYSGAYKYMFIKDGKKYFLKIGGFKFISKLEELFTKYSISHPTIIDYGKYDDSMNYIIEEYVDGKDLKEELDKRDSKFIYEYGFEIGSQYRNLRTVYPDKPMSEEKFKEYSSMVDDRVIKLKSLVFNNDKLTANNHKYINYVISYLNNNIHITKNSYLVFGHTDIKPSNFLVCNKNIIATDIEYTDYKELSLSMLWSFARNDFKDEKNFAFARGYIDALFNFNIPENVLNCFNYTYLFNMAKYFIKYIENEKYDKLSQLIEYINTNYMVDGELKINEKMKNYINIKHFEILNGYNITLVKGSYNPNNLTFKCQKDKENYFLKIMKMSFKHYKKSISSYNIMNKCNIPISPITKHGCILEDKCYYTISKFIELNEMEESINDTFIDGFKSGELVASYLIKLKDKKIENIETYDKNQLFNDMMKYVEEIYGNIDISKYIHWTKRELKGHISKYIKSFESEPINLIHGDVKFGNILYDEDKIFFIDNESLQYSFDIINFMYNIQAGFLENENLRYKGFVNGYLKYMNNGVIPSRIQNQVKLLLIYYVLRIIRNILHKKSDESKIKFVLKGCIHYIDKDNEIEWLK